MIESDCNVKCFFVKSDFFLRSDFLERIFLIENHRMDSIVDRIYFSVYCPESA